MNASAAALLGDRTFDIDFPAQVFDDAVDHRQPQARAFARLLGSEEWLENAIEVLACDTAAAVGNSDVAERADQLAVDGDGAVFGAGIAGIREQIDEHLQQPLVVGEYVQTGWAVIDEVHRAGTLVESEQVNCLSGTAIDQDRLWLRACAA